MKDLFTHLLKERKKQKEMESDDIILSSETTPKEFIELWAKSLDNDTLVNMCASAWHYFSKSNDEDKPIKIVESHKTNFEVFKEELLRRMEGSK